MVKTDSSKLTKEEINKEFSKGTGFESVIGDMDTTLVTLNEEKTKAQKALSKINTDLKIDHDLENDLQLQIAQLVEEEAKLSEKRKRLESKIEQVSNKLRKVSKN